MASNSFGKMFRISTWGESRGTSIGVVIDGCPAGIEISEDEINAELAKHFPGKHPYPSPLAGPDRAIIQSGVFEGKTTGAPVAIMIPNHDVDSSKFEPIKNLLRPGHSNYTYLEKYGIYDYRGGGRASARETVSRIAAGAVAKKFLKKYNIVPLAYIKEIAGIEADVTFDQLKKNPQLIQESPVLCPDRVAASKMVEKIAEAREQKDSVGGVVELFVDNMPVGLGDPMYEKLEATLAFAFMSIPATKGFEIGSGFMAARMRGSEHNDTFTYVDDHVRTKTNHAGGILGGISTGMPIIIRVAFKPTSSILQPQETIDIDGQPGSFQLPPGSRIDPCLAIRGVSVVEAMAALVIADAILFNWCSRVD